MERFIGGESQGRSFLGGRRNKPRSIGLAIVLVAGAIGVIVWKIPALVVTLVAVAAVYAVTETTHFGSPLQRWQDRRRWKERTRLGLTRFRPVTDRPAALEDDMLSAKRRQRRALTREWNVYRDWPDGVEGLNWLMAEPRQPGILWHTPTGEESYFTVVFPVSGQIQGLEGDDAVERAASRFGGLLAGWGSARSLASRVQMLTRVLPIDSARHERWVLDNVDTEAPRALLESYDEVVRALGRGGLMQRHYAVIRWPMDGQFIAHAQRRGEGEEGWLALLTREIDSAWRRLANAGLGPGNPLTAAEVAAVLRHLQMPSWPIDQAGDVPIYWPWLGSEDEWSYTKVEAQGPDGRVEQWFHRTARIAIDGVGTGPRTPLWMMPILAHLPHDIVRSVSSEIEMIPAREARAQARLDLTSDLADLHAQASKGALTSEDLEVSVRGAKSRRDDLAPGSGVHGAGWAMHVSLSARSLEELAEATAVLEEALGGDMDIEQLEWLDSYQAAAAATCWPVARGMAPVEVGRSQRLRRLLAGKGTKEAIA